MNYTVTSLEYRIARWVIKVRGSDSLFNIQTRNYRFFEEAIELVQSCGMTREECLKLIDHVYSRPKGEPQQEVGGVMLTLAALCFTSNIHLDFAAELELERIWQKIEEIKVKESNKPL